MPLGQGSQEKPWRMFQAHCLPALPKEGQQPKREGDQVVPERHRPLNCFQVYKGNHKCYKMCACSLFIFSPLLPAQSLVQGFQAEQPLPLLPGPLSPCHV
jgi:hypothetical protein